METVTETDGGYHRHCEKTVTETMAAAVTGVVTEAVIETMTAAMTETDGGCDTHASKVMLKILQARLQQYLNCELPDVQAGFRKGRGTRDHWERLRAGGEGGD